MTNDIEKIDNADITEELERLRKENKRLQRSLNNLSDIIDRERMTSSARAGISAVLLQERSKQEKYMNLMLENSLDFIFLMDREEKFAYCTDVFLKYTGIPSFGLVGGRTFKEIFSKLVGKDWTDRIVEIFTRALKKKESVTIDEVLDLGGGGVKRNYSIQFTPMLDERGGVEGSMVIFHDFTAITMAKEQAERAKDEAERASQAKSDFLANMSHEIRTPMNAIIGMTNIAQNSSDDEKRVYCLEKIEEASKHLLGVINDILDMSKIEANKFELSDAEFDFDRMLMRVSDVIGFKIHEKNQTFSVVSDKNIPRFLIADEHRLMQVLSNLLSNAVKFTPESGAVTLTADFVGEEKGKLRLRFEVRDTGIGISEEDQKKLFRSFQQADNSISRKFGGTGLGLAISRNIVSLMGGEIWVKSEAGRGSAFGFSVLIRRGDRRHPPYIPVKADWQGLKILAVDDDDMVLEFFKNTAASLGVKCDVATGGEQAIEMLDKAEVPYNVTFIDYKMPGMNGVDLSKVIKERYGEETLVIMISAYEWSYIKEKAKTAGVDKFIPKPLFLSTIEECIADCAGLNAGAEAALPNRDYQGKRVLLAEDIEINREILITLLDGTGIEIDVAENGRKAVEKFNQNQYDLVFMDIHMPEMDGYEATRRIRISEEKEALSDEILAAGGLGGKRGRGGRHGKRVPVIAMTANVFKEDVDRCIAAGMDAHIGKPLNLSEVYVTLEKYLKQGKKDF